MVKYSNIFVNEGLSYLEYRELVDSQLEINQTTGSDHGEALVRYTRLNVQRMNRADKIATLHDDFVNAISGIQHHYRMLVISEGWCGDAAQLIPVFHKIAEHAPAKFEMRLVLRDTNLPLIDAHLTNGGRAIPKVLFLNDNDELVAEWGPRPGDLQVLLDEWKKEVSDIYALAEKLHYWYAADKTQTTQLELTGLMKKLK